VFPGASNWEDFLVRLYDDVVDVDSFGYLEALNQYAESPEEISRKFDIGTYAKGAVILRMLKDAITDEVFIQGVKYYLDEMQFKSATPEDLFNNLQKAVNEANPGNNVNISQFMDMWTNSRGLPMVTVTRSGNGLLLTQSGVRATSEELFSIPINYATASNPNFDDVAAEFWMTAKEHEIHREAAEKTWTDDDWIIFNLRDTGYYLTNYDDNLWDLITSSLANDHEKIHHLNRGTLFADTYRFIQQAINFRATVFLGLMDSLKLEHHPHVWRRANLGLGHFDTRLRGTDSYALFLNFFSEVMGQVYGTTFESDDLATDIINHYSCVAGVQECGDDALQALIEVIENGSTDFQFDFRCNAFRVSNESLWMQFFEEIIPLPPNWDRTFALLDLGCTRNPKLIQQSLDASINMTSNLLLFERVFLMQQVVMESLEGYNAVIKLIEDNHRTINEE
jgi:hypothetical protein